MRSFVNKIRGSLRLALFFFHTLYWLIFLLIWDSLGKLNDGNRLGYRERWSRGMARLVGFRFTFSGELPDGGPYLFVGNHRSTLDPLLAFYKIQAWPLSKAWVKDWPLVGRGSQLTGIIFVVKESKNSRHAAKERILEELEKGNSILIYPEGHTHVEPLTKTFHKGSYEQAAKGDFPVVPFILEYKDVEDYWDHTENFVQHFIRAFGKRRHDVHLGIGPVLRSDNPWTLMRESRKWIDQAMVDIHREWGNTHYDHLDPENLWRDNPEIKTGQEIKS